MIMMKKIKNFFINLFSVIFLILILAGYALFKHGMPKSIHVKSYERTSSKTGETTVVKSYDRKK